MFVIIFCLFFYFLVLEFGVLAGVNPDPVLPDHDDTLTLDERALSKELLLGVLVQLLSDVKGADTLTKHSPLLCDHRKSYKKQQSLKGI